MGVAGNCGAFFMRAWHGATLRALGREPGHTDEHQENLRGGEIAIEKRCAWVYCLPYW